ncbi:hypothetical protein NDU88_002419 [Pleurodeles waltl]|uniref:Uncharacterized protein n=2 Tax=Pleurodeles waltl TaxID=8319 RepID=A0AAV7KS39_PLEWA|nr:hypothetical protein NDU88_002419 [Pleurodeles waltl]
MGGKLSKKKKGCYGDHTDEAADEPSEAPVEQKDNETDANEGLNSENTLKGEQPDTNGLQSEETSKNELQVGEIVNHVKEAAEASKDQTKDSQLSPNSEDLKLAQTKGAVSENEKVNGEGTHSEPEVGSSVSAESKPEKTQPAIVEKNDPEICSNNTSENKAKEASATIQSTSTNGANENHTKCATDSDKNVSNADESVSSISTENTCNALSVKEKDSICLNVVNPSVNSACSNPPADVASRDSTPSALQESPNKKNTSESDKIDGGLLKSSDEEHPIICEDTSFKQSLNDSNTIDDHEQVTTVVSKSDILLKSTESHKDESYNCELLNTAQETKSECLNTDHEFDVKQGACTAPGEDISVTAGDDECLAQKYEEAPKDQTSSLSETKPDFDSVPNQEDSINLESSLAPSKVETNTETKIVDEATVITVTESESTTALTEVISTAVQKVSLDPLEVEPTPEVVQSSVTLVQSTSDVGHLVTQMEVESATESETCVTSVAEESTTEPEASGATVEEISLVESPSTKAPAVNISSSVLEPCKIPEKATSEVDLEGTVATLASSSESRVAPMEEAYPGKIKVDEVLTEVVSPGEIEKDEIEVSSPTLVDCIVQKGVVGLGEPAEVPVQREAASPEEEGQGTEPEQAASPCKAEENVTEMHKISKDEMEDSVVNGEGTFAPDIEAPVTSEHRSSMIRASAVEPDYPAEPEIPVMPVEHEECVTTADTPDIAKVEADATPVNTASSNSDACKGLSEVVTMKDTCNAQEHQEEGQESTGEKYPEEPNSEKCPEILQGTEINVVNKKENEVQNAADLKIEGSSEYVIQSEVPQNSEVVLNGDS